MVSTVTERLSRIISQLIVAVEEKAMQLDQMSAIISQQEVSISELKAQLEAEKAKVLALSAAQ